MRWVYCRSREISSGLVIHAISRLPKSTYNPAIYLVLVGIEKGRTVPLCSTGLIIVEYLVCCSTPC